MTSQSDDNLKESTDNPILIKKYPNRRLYNTATSGYIVLDDIVKLVKDGTAFVIHDTKTGEDITRSILNQIIFERETKPSNYHFPLDVQKQLIGMYDDTYAKMVPGYLRESMNLFTNERERMSAAVENAVGRNAQAMMEFSQNIARQNMEIFKRSWEMFGGSVSNTSNEETGHKDTAPVDERERELKDIQDKINALQSRLKSLK